MAVPWVAVCNWFIGFLLAVALPSGFGRWILVFIHNLMGSKS
jgi:hypothetical protein